MAKQTAIVERAMSRVSSPTRVLPPRSRMSIADMERSLAQTPLYIRGLLAWEREWMREQIWYSGVGEDYIVTTMASLALALCVFQVIRKRKTAKVRFADGVYSITN